MDILLKRKTSFCRLNFKEERIFNRSLVLGDQLQKDENFKQKNLFLLVINLKIRATNQILPRPAQLPRGMQFARPYSKQNCEGSATFIPKYFLSVFSHIAAYGPTHIGWCSHDYAVDLVHFVSVLYKHAPQ